MLGSLFQHVLFMDTDAFFLSPPETFIRKLIESQKPGVPWYDMYGMDPRNHTFKYLRVKPLRGLGEESGVVYIDKRVAWDALCVAGRMNQKQTLYYRFLHGDKGTFYLAFELTKRDYVDSITSWISRKWNKYLKLLWILPLPV